MVSLGGTYIDRIVGDSANFFEQPCSRFHPIHPRISAVVLGHVGIFCQSVYFVSYGITLLILLTVIYTLGIVVSLTGTGFLIGVSLFNFRENRADQKYAVLPTTQTGQ